jgi:hypothetical protein
MKIPHFWKSLRWVFVACLWGQFLQAQMLEGTIQDSLGQTVPGAILQIVNPQQQVVAYQLSDALGRYRFEKIASQDSLWLFVQAFEFESQRIFLSPNILATARQNIVLQYKQIELETVQISASPYRIKTQGDTVVINTRPFLDSTERNLEELLRKIPNVRVDAEGIIYYKNQQVEEVLLDGDNLFGSNYTLLTRSLSAVLVEDLEFVNNYQPNKALQGLYQSDRLALNLSLKGEVKKLLAGNIRAALGNDERRDIAANLLSFLDKKQKLFANVQHQNTGFSLLNTQTSGTEDSPLPAGIGQNYNFLRFPSRTLNAFSIINPVFLDESRTHFNSPLLSSLSYSLKTKPLQVQATLLYYGDAIRQNYEQRTNYNLEQGQRLNIRESQALENRHQALGGRLQVSSQENSRSTWRYMSIWQNFRFNNSRNSIFSSLNTVGLLQDSVREVQQQHMRLWENHFDYTLRIQKNTAISFFLRQKLLLHQEQGLSEGSIARYTLQEEENPQSNRARQNLDQPWQEWHTGLSYMYKSKREHQWLHNVAVKYRQEALQGAAAFGNGDLLSTSEAFEADNQYQSRLYYTQHFWQKNYQRWLFKAGIQSNIQQIVFERRASRRDSNFFWLNPSLQIRYRTKRWEGSLQYDYQKRNPLNVLLLSENRILSDFRNVRQGVEVFSLIARHLVQASLFRANALQTSTFLWSANYAYNDRSYASVFNFNPLLSTSQKILIGSSRQAFMLFETEQYLFPLSSRLKISATALYALQPNVIEGIGERSNELYNYQWDMRMATALDIPLNFVLGGSLQYNQIQIQSDFGRTFLDNTFYQADCQVLLGFGQTDKRSKVNLKWGHYLIWTDASPYYLSDGLLRWSGKLAGRAFPLELRAYNLFNERFFRQEKLSDITASLANYQLLPRFVTLGTQLYF